MDKGHMGHRQGNDYGAWELWKGVEQQRVPKGGERLITRHTSLGNVPMLTHTFYAGWIQGVNNNNQKIQS